MAELNNFDANVIDPVGKFTPIPMDDYLAQIVESTMADTKKGDGRFLKLTFEVADGEFKGRRIFEQLNLVNPNEKTVEIAQRTLSAICRSVGVLHPKDSAELHNIPLVISVGIQAGKDGYDDKNVIKKYSRVDGKELTDITDVVPAGKATAAAPAKKPKPWEVGRK
jgi:hypothetical protein